MRFERTGRPRDSPKSVVWRAGHGADQNPMFLFATDCIACVILRLTVPGHLRRHETLPSKPGATILQSLPLL